MKRLNLFKIKQDLLFFIILINVITILDISVLRIYKKINIIFLPILLFILLDKGQIKKYVLKYLIWGYVFFGFIVLQIFFTSGIGIGAFYNYLTIISLFLCIKKLGLTKRQLNIILIMSCIILIKYCFLAKGYGALHYNSVLNGSNNYINTNVVSFMTCLLAMFSWIEINKKKELNLTVKFIASIVIAFMSLYIIVNMESRSSYIAITLFYICMYLVNKRILQRKNLLLMVYIVLIIVSFIIPKVYIYMYDNNINISKVGSISKDTFTGREILWKNQFEIQLSSIKTVLLGLGSKYEENYMAGDMHSNSMTIFKNYGVIGVIFIYGYLSVQIKKVKLNNKENINYLVAFLCTLIIGLFEGIIAYTPTAIIMMLFLGLASMRENSQLQENKNENFY